MYEVYIADSFYGLRSSSSYLQFKESSSKDAAEIAKYLADKGLVVAIVKVEEECAAI